MRSRSCLARNLDTISGPKVKDTPLSFSPQPMVSLSGSAHNKSHSNPAQQYYNIICKQYITTVKMQSTVHTLNAQEVIS